MISAGAEGIANSAALSNDAAADAGRSSGAKAVSIGLTGKFAGKIDDARTAALGEFEICFW